MKRRTVLKHFFIIAGGIAIFPSCSGDPAKASIELKHISLSADEEALLAEIAETIIPAGDDGPGSKELNLHLFTMKMVDDCTQPADREKFIEGLKAFATYKDASGQTFLKSPSNERAGFIQTILTDKTVSPAKTFLEITKKQVVRGFTQSKFVLVDKKQYEMVPGRYNGFFPVPQA